MKNLIVFDHPYGIQASENEVHNRSFCAALCKSVTQKLKKRGEEVEVIDLIAEGFDPVMNAQDLKKWRKGEPMNEQVASYQHKLKTCDRVIFIFPIWWELMPAATKGFLDKVYAKDILYKSGEGKFGMQSVIPDTEVVALTTMETPTIAYKILFGKPVVKALQTGLSFKTGIKSFRWIPFSGMSKMSLEKRQQLLRDVQI